MEQRRLDQLVIGKARSTRGLWQARVVFGIGENSRKRVDLDDVRHAGRVEANVDPRPVAAAEHPIRAKDDVFDRGLELVVDARRALEDVEWVAGRIPDPLRLVAV